MSYFSFSRWLQTKFFGRQGTRSSQPTRRPRLSLELLEARLAPSATQLVITTQPPTTVTAGSPFGLVVTAENANNTVDSTFTGSVTVSDSNFYGYGAASLGGTTTVQAVKGVATFSGLTLDAAESDQLNVFSGDLSGATTQQFTITPAAATKLVASVPTGVVTNGTFDLTVNAEDPYGNTDPTFNGNVTVALGSNPGSATLGGTLTETAVNGEADFPDLTINQLGNGYTITASTNGLASSTTTPFDVTDQLVVTTQPPGTISAGSPFGLVVTAEDANGIVDTSFTASITVADDDGNALGGTTTIQAVGGVATFSGLTLDTATYADQLDVTSGVLPAVSSQEFSVTPLAATQLAVVLPTGGIVAGAQFTVTVNAVDPYGNVDPTFNGDVTIALASNPTNTTLGGTLTETAVDGVATFSDLAINTLGNGYTLEATASGLPAATSSSFDVTNQLVITTQPPSDITAGSSFGLVAEVEDGSGNEITSFNGSVTVALNNIDGYYGGPDGTLQGTLTVKAVNGVATFSGLTVDQANDYTLSVSAVGLPTATTDDIEVDAGTATHLVVNTPYDADTSVATGSILSSPLSLSVEAEDAYGNTDSSFSGNVTVALANNPTGAILGGTLTMAADSGYASFSDLTINKLGNGYTLKATSTGLTSGISASFAIGDQLSITTPPPSTVTAGTSFGFAVSAENGLGNVDSSYSGNITVALTSYSSSSTTPNLVTVTVAAVKGVATFSGLKVDQTGYCEVEVTANGQGSTQTYVNVTAAAASKLVVSTLPSAVTAGAGFNVGITAEDPFGNLATSFNGNVTIALAKNPGNSTLGGTLMATATNGVASFSGLTLNKVGSGTTLLATSSGLSQVTTNPIQVTAPGVATQLVITTQPSSSLTAGSPFEIVVKAEDGFGTVDTTFNGSVTLALEASTEGGLLSGTTTVTASSGVATFSGLKLDGAAPANVIIATSKGLAEGTTAAFAVNAGTATKLVVQLYDNVLVGAPFYVSVEAQDAYGNIDPTFNGNVALTLNANTAGATLGGTLTVTATDGSASFDDLTMSQTGTGFILDASSTGLPTATSSSFSVYNEQLVATTQPPNYVTVGSSFGTAFSAENSSGQVDTTFNGNVTISLINDSETSGAKLSGTLTVKAQQGVATFSGLSLNQAGDYGLTAASPGLGSAGSQSTIFVTGSVSSTPGPEVTGISPAVGPAAGGTKVTITGTNLGAATVVYFGTTPATLVSVSNTQIVATSPAGTAGTVDVTVATVESTSATSSADHFSYLGAAFSNLSSPTINYGTAKTTVSGQLSPSAESLPTGTMVQVTLDGHTQNATVGSNGLFSTTFATSTLGVTNSPYVITFNYAGNTTFPSATATSNLTVIPATPTITWNKPANISYGTALGSSQLDASTGVPGTFSYTLADDMTPASGAVLEVGQSQVLNVSFTPTDTTDYNTATGTVQINVLKATPTITFATPSSSISYVSNETFTFSATASLGGTVVLSLDPSSTGTGGLSGDVLTITSPGSFVIDANQAGTSNYNAAPQVQETLVVTQPYQPTLSQNENGTPTVETVSKLLGSFYNDPDGSSNTKEGIAIVGTSGNGNWQYSANGSSWTNLSSVTMSNALLLPGSDSLRFLPTANASGQAVLSFLTWDGSQGTSGSYFNIATTGGASPFSSNTGTLTVTVNPVPIWVGSGAELTSILPGTYSVSNTSTPAGNPVSTIFGTYFHDDNAAVSVGVAVTALSATANGTWQYSLNSGSTWTTFPTVSTTSALLLSATDLVRFVPTGSFAGVGTLTALAWDGSTGTPGALINPSKASSTAFSSTTLVATAAVNNAPTLNATSTTLPAIGENTTSAAIGVSNLLSSAGYTDPDGNKLAQGIAVIGITAAPAGTLQYLLSGSSIWQTLSTTPALTSALLLPSTASLRFVSSSQVGTATLTYLGWDQTQGSAGQTFNITSQGDASAFSANSATASLTVKPVPSWSSSTGASFTSILPGTSPTGQTVTSVFGSFFQDANASVTVGIAVVGLTGTSNGTWQYSTNNGTSWTNMSATISTKTALLLSANDLLQFVPKGSFAGVATLTALAWDGGTGKDGVTLNLSSSSSTGGTTAFSSTTLAATDAVNNAPTVQGTSATLPAIPENTTGTATAVTTLLTSANYADPDGKNLSQGVAIVGVTTGSAGSWQFKLSGGSWQTLSTMLSLSSGLLLPSTASVRFVSTDQLGTATLTYLGWDQTQGIAGQTFNIGSPGPASAFSSILATASLTVHQAPSWTSSTGASFPSILPGTTNPTGQTVKSVFGSYFQDVNSSVPVGIAVVGLTGTTSSGTWQYSTNAGTSWSNISSTISTKTALLLSTSDLLRFVPASGFAGVVTLTALAWDGSTGTDGGTQNFSSSSSIGGATAFSATTLIATLTVSKAPSWTSGVTASFTPVLGYSASNPTPTPSGDTVQSVFASAFNDAMTGTTVGIAVVGLTGTADGTWEYDNGSGWASFPTTVGASSNGTALLLSGTDSIRFVPGKAFSGTVSLTVRAWDGSTGTDGGTILLSKIGTSGSNAFSSTTLVANCFVNSAPVLV